VAVTDYNACATDNSNRRMILTTPLCAEHEVLGAELVPFAGWRMPLRYRSTLDEHHAVRRTAGMFDVSHMAVIDLFGDRTADFLRRVLANDIAKLTAPGRALYTCMLNEQGGVIDDLIAYRLGGGRWRLVVNAATRAGDLAWLLAQADAGPAAPDRIEVNAELAAAAAGGARVAARAEDLALIAVQGPEAVARVGAVFGSADLAAVEPFAVLETGGWTLARTGYTGEDGVEIMLPASDAAPAWQALCAAGVVPCGLAARDTLRLEAGLNLYGQDMDETISPLECALGWTVDLNDAERHFIGRAALEQLRRDGPRWRQVGLVLDGRGVLRHGQALYTATGAEAGVVTSGGFAPTLGLSIALARLAHGIAAAELQVEIRGRRLAVRVVKPPFVRHGRARPAILLEK